MILSEMINKEKPYTATEVIWGGIYDQLRIRDLERFNKEVMMDSEKYKCYLLFKELLKLKQN
jgi:hypothetical protein